MAFVNPDPTYAHQAERVIKLYQLVCDIRDRYAVGETDTRRVSLNNVAMAANAAASTLRLLHWAKEGGEKAMTAALGLTKSEYIQFVAEDLLRASRLWLLVESQFQIETAFRNVLAALTGAGRKQGFYNLAKDMLTAVSVPDVDRKLATLNLAALMRNSLHANGIHSGWDGSDTIESVNGVEYRFEHGKRVQCGSWFHIVTALTASLEIFDEILSAPEVCRIASISDTYADHKASERS